MEFDISKVYSAVNADEGHPGYSDSEPQYNCPNCSCKDCYRVSCQFNKSELFKKLHKEYPELYENEKE